MKKTSYGCYCQKFGVWFKWYNDKNSVPDLIRNDFNRDLSDDRPSIYLLLIKGDLGKSRI